MQITEETEEQVRIFNRSCTAEVSRINQTRPTKENDNKMTYKYCGKTHPWRKDSCPAYGKKCAKCGRFNHFVSVCKSKTGYNDQQRSQYDKERNAHKMGQNMELPHFLEEEGDNFIGDSIRHLQELQIHDAHINKVRDYDNSSNCCE